MLGVRVGGRRGEEARAEAARGQAGRRQLNQEGLLETQQLPALALMRLHLIPLSASATFLTLLIQVRLEK